MRPGFEIPSQFEPVESGRRATDVAVQAFRRRVDVGESVPARDEGAVVVIVGGRGAGYFERTVGILIIDEGFGGRGAFARPVGAIDTSDFFIAPVSDEIPRVATSAAGSLAVPGQYPVMLPPRRSATCNCSAGNSRGSTNVAAPFSYGASTVAMILQSTPVIWTAIRSKVVFGGRFRMSVITSG